MWLSNLQEIEVFVTLFLSLFVLIGLGLTFGPPIWQVMRYKNTKYLITSQRLITSTGAIGVDTRFIDLENIQEVYVNVGFVESLWDRNTCRSDSGLSLSGRNISSHCSVGRALQNSEIAPRRTNLNVENVDSTRISTRACINFMIEQMGSTCAND